MAPVPSTPTRGEVWLSDRPSQIRSHLVTDNHTDANVAVSYDGLLVAAAGCTSLGALPTVSPDVDADVAAMGTGVGLGGEYCVPVWDIATGRLVHELFDPQTGATFEYRTKRVVFSSQFKAIAALSSREALCVEHARPLSDVTPDQLDKMPPPPPPQRGPYRIVVYSTETGKAVWCKTTRHMIDSIVDFPSTRSLACIQSNGDVALIDWPSGDVLRKLPGGAPLPTNVADARHDVRASCTAMLKDTRDVIQITNNVNNVFTRVMHQASGIRGIDLARSGEYIAVQYATWVDVLSTRTGASVCAATAIRPVGGALTDYPTCIALSPHGDVLLVGTSTGVVAVWNVKRAKRVRVLECGTMPVLSVGMSRDSRYVITYTTRRGVAIWEVI